jgi:signal peptidase I
MAARGAFSVSTSGPDDPAPLAATTASADTTATLSVDSRPTSYPAEPPGDARPAKDHKPAWRVAVEWVVLIAVALGIAFLIKSFLFQAFYIPSESMTPTLKVGDRVLVNKLSYDFHDLNRGDIVVFQAPPRAQSGGIEDLVKRVIGLPGDTVTFPGDGHVYVNGHVLNEPYLPKGVETCDPSLPCPSQQPGTSVPPDCGIPANGQPGCVVPRGKAFMMGDNREASKDSRVFGPINEDTIVGRVFLRIWPLDSIGFL